jgi:hypothetical protein
MSGPLPLPIGLTCYTNVLRVTSASADVTGPLAQMISCAWERLHPSQQAWLARRPRHSAAAQLGTQQSPQQRLLAAPVAARPQLGQRTPPSARATHLSAQTPQARSQPSPDCVGRLQSSNSVRSSLPDPAARADEIIAARFQRPRPSEPCGGPSTSERGATRNALPGRCLVVTFAARKPSWGSLTVRFHFP